MEVILAVPRDKQSLIILIADDDPDDRLMIKEALSEKRPNNPLHFVEDGEELMDYLFHRGKYASPGNQPLPGLILLDLNMPKKDGREALREIKADPVLRRIPVVILTTSKMEEDIRRTYLMGVNSFVTKPVSFDALVDMMQTITKYWLDIVELPVVNGG